MQSFTYTVKDELGIHARPAGLLAKLAMTFASDVKLVAPAKTVDAKRIMAVMGAGVKQGNDVTIECIGADEEAACQALKAFFEENL